MIQLAHSNDDKPDLDGKREMVVVHLQQLARDGNPALHHRGTPPFRTRLPPVSSNSNSNAAAAEEEEKKKKS